MLKSNGDWVPLGGLAELTHDPKNNRMRAKGTPDLAEHPERFRHVRHKRLPPRPW